MCTSCTKSFCPPTLAAYMEQTGCCELCADFRKLPMEKLETIVCKMLNPNRVSHVLGCRDTAVALARHWNANERNAARAGLLHDITKALDGQRQLTLSEEYGIILTAFQKSYPKTLHALTGSLVAERMFGENEEVVRAIRYHTTGKADMSLLEKIIYVADYMEPNRDFPGVEKLREAAYSDLDEAVRLGLRMTLELLNQQGSEISPASREALDWLEGKDK